MAESAVDYTERMLKRAREQQLRTIYEGPRRFRVASQSQEGEHVVTIAETGAAFCDCTGFGFHQVCTHSATVSLIRQGELPCFLEPQVLAQTICCSRCGTVERALSVTDGKWYCAPCEHQARVLADDYAEFFA